MTHDSQEKKRYWLLFDLGLRGNYEELYTWLDNIQAFECGENLATFRDDKTPERIGKELAALLGKKARIYLINESKGKLCGTFLLGGRKRPPWAGHGGLEYPSGIDIV